MDSTNRHTKEYEDEEIENELNQQLQDVLIVNQNGPLETCSDDQT